jgi:hypothetical protein
MEALYGIYKSMKDRVEQILPSSQRTNLVFNKEYNYSDSPFTWLHEFIFVIEKYLNSKIPQTKYRIVYSAQYSAENLHENSIKKLQQLEKLLQNGDVTVNLPSLGFLPPSSKSYFKSGNFNVDFTNQFYGIKHFHLCSDDRNRDELLYYVINESKIYFLSIGGHSKLYDQENIEIIVREFPDIAAKLGIVKMPDMPVDSSFEYSVQQLKEQWTSGGNSSFLIDEAYYTTVHPQTTSRLNTEIINVTKNIIYQYETALNSLKSKLVEEYRIVPLRFEDNSLMRNGVILIGDETSKMAVEVRITYLEKLEVVDQFSALN